MTWPSYLSIFLALKLDVIPKNLNAIAFVCVHEVTRKFSVHRRGVIGRTGFSGVS